jgi:hypothetical protein
VTELAIKILFVLPDLLPGFIQARVDAIKHLADVVHLKPQCLEVIAAILAALAPIAERESLRVNRIKFPDTFLNALRIIVVPVFDLMLVRLLTTRFHSQVRSNHTGSFSFWPFLSFPWDPRILSERAEISFQHR